MIGLTFALTVGLCAGVAAQMVPQTSQQITTLWGEKRLSKVPPTPDQLGVYLLHMRPWEYRLEKMRAKSDINC
jgi:hypothetical protein